MGKVKSYLQQMMEDESQYLYAVYYHTKNDLDVRGAYIQCDSIWHIEEEFKSIDKYFGCMITQIECMNSICKLSSNGKLLHTTRFLNTLKNYLKHYRANNVSIKVDEERG